MIYVDMSVVLAELLAEDRRPAESFWNETLVSSRLLEYEVWIRVHGRKLARSHGDAARALVGRVALLELVSPVLTRALEPFPRPAGPTIPGSDSSARTPRHCLREGWSGLTCRCRV
jgi:hypothetical protein